MSIKLLVFSYLFILATRIPCLIVSNWNDDQTTFLCRNSLAFCRKKETEVFQLVIELKDVVCLTNGFCLKLHARLPNCSGKTKKLSRGGHKHHFRFRVITSKRNFSSQIFQTSITHFLSSMGNLWGLEFFRIIITCPFSEEKGRSLCIRAAAEQFSLVKTESLHTTIFRVFLKSEQAPGSRKKCKFTSGNFEKRRCAEKFFSWIKIRKFSGKNLRTNKLKYPSKIISTHKDPS